MDSTPPDDLVASLRDLLGTKLTSYLGSAPDEPTFRLQAAHRVATMLCERDTPAVVQAWFQGMNELLDDASPARVLRDGDLDVDVVRVMVAARAFAAQG